MKSRTGRLAYDFHQSVGYWVISTSRALQRALDAELGPLGVTHQQWRVLAQLAREEDVSQAELALRLGVEPPTLAGILDRMERDGWISRRPCPSDGRKKLVRTHRRVEPVWERMVACARRVRARAVRNMSRERLEELEATLAALRTNLGEDEP